MSIEELSITTIYTIIQKPEKEHEQITINSYLHLQ